MFSLATGFFPRQLPGATPGAYFGLAIVTALLFFFSVLFHELSHSLVAKRFGIPIERISLFVFGGVAQMTKEPETPISELLMSIAGPISSFFLGMVFGAFYLLFTLFRSVESLAVPARYLCFVNFALGAFNLVPAFPLDGGRVFRSLVWYFSGNLVRSTRVASLIGEGTGFAMIVFGFFLLFRGDWGNGLWLMFIGWFLQQAASASYQQLLLRQSLAGIKASDIMTPTVLSVPPSISLEELVHDWFLKYRVSRFPVVDDEKIYGIVTMHDVKETPREEWPFTRVGDIVRPISEDEMVAPESFVTDLLQKMSAKELSHFLVIKDDRLVGIITKTDILKTLRLRHTLLHPSH